MLKSLVCKIACSMTEIMPKVCKNPFSALLTHSTVFTKSDSDLLSRTPFTKSDSQFTKSERPFTKSDSRFTKSDSRFTKSERLFNEGVGWSDDTTPAIYKISNSVCV